MEQYSPCTTRCHSKRCRNHALIHQTVLTQFLFYNNVETHIDLKNKVINVNKTVYSKLKDNKGRWYLGTTKTEGSCREVYINETLYKALNNYKNKQNLLKKIGE